MRFEPLTLRMDQLRAVLPASECELLPLLVWAEPVIDSQRKRVYDVLEKLDARLPNLFDSASLGASIDTAFSREIIAWTHRTLLLDLALARHCGRLSGRTSEDRFLDFIQDISSARGRKRIARDYPMLGRDTAMRTRQIAHSLTGVLRHVAADHTCLTAFIGLPGRLRSIELQKGDRHDNGDTVSKLEFEGGALFHKPRSGAIDLAFSQLLRWLHEHGVKPDQRAPAVLDRGRHSYAAVVSHDPVESPSDFALYYSRYGGLLAIAHLLAASDMHFENIIANGAFPVLIDLETLFQPCRRAHIGGRFQQDPYFDTVLHTRMLPIGEPDPAARDISGLRHEPDQVLGQRRIPIHGGTDQLHLSLEPVPIEPAQNLPYINGVAVGAPPHLTVLLEGFESTYRTLMQLGPQLADPDGPLSSFRRLSVRVLARPTPVYGQVLNALSHPSFLTDADKRDEAVARLKMASPMQGDWLRIWPYERKALLQADVPRFTARVDERDILFEGSPVFKRAYRRSGWQEVQLRLQHLTEKDLGRQRRLIRLAVESMVPGKDKANAMAAATRETPPVQAVYDRALYLAEARRIGDILLKRSFGGASSITHFQLEARNNSHLCLYPLGPFMYDGLSGLALFFAELALLSGVQRYRRASEALLSTARRTIDTTLGKNDPIGAFSGLGGWIYTLGRLGVSWKSTELIDEACSWIPRVRDRIAQDKDYDIIAGSAGLILVALELESIAPGNGAAELAHACATHLVSCAHRSSAGVNWPIEAQEGLAFTGFGHGSGGIAAALARYAEFSGEQSFARVACDAMNAERSSYDASSGVWRDVREATRIADGGPAQSYAWCHGAPGIGLGRLLMPLSMRDTAWHADVESCLSVTRQHGFDHRCCLCHGHWGNLELLMLHAEQFPIQGGNRAADEWHQLSAQFLAQIPQMLKQEAWIGPDTGLMTGLAGVGYGLLRAAAPDSVPSVLSLEMFRRKPSLASKSPIRRASDIALAGIPA
ncbi:type 2 lanthipeptide synthetase LanM [Dyella sp. 20L07]|uniref:type 2 lanthipeptide synthetase LanM n=1 Tax=Dyella sp. 20L07 TaxID=3384240 RepID=UPI003D29948D